MNEKIMDEIMIDYKNMLLFYLREIDNLIENGENEEKDFNSLVNSMNDSNKEFM
jgi:hypothetical protein